jgi:acyl-coenzyme A synthetase/AMP-(fatty) acid ligase
VHEAAVVGRSDPVLGEVPVAFVCFAEGAGDCVEELREHLAGRLAKYKLPVTISSLPELPKNPVGKIDKPTLRRRVAEAQAPQPG